MDFCKTDACKLKPDTEAIFISSRVRLARNIDGELFASKNSIPDRRRILSLCESEFKGVRKFTKGKFFNLEELSVSDREILLERNLISKNLADSKEGKGVFLTADCQTSVMINEEDHLRIQVSERGLCLESLWSKIDALDNQIAQKIPYSFHDRYGYLTACPTNVGTGMRASVMMHLIGLKLSEQIEPVIRGLNHLGIVARGSNGEGSEPLGAFYQISNQQTLGSSEEQIIEKITQICVKLADFENNARKKLFEDSPSLILDKISRAWAVLSSAYVITSTEAIDCLSALRLAADLGFMPAKSKVLIDTMLLEVRPAHLERDFGSLGMGVKDRDILRAEILKEGLKDLKKPSLSKTKKLK